MHKALAQRKQSTWSHKIYSFCSSLYIDESCATSNHCSTIWSMHMLLIWRNTPDWRRTRRGRNRALVSIPCLFSKCPFFLRILSSRAPSVRRMAMGIPSMCFHSPKDKGHGSLWHKMRPREAKKLRQEDTSPPAAESQNKLTMTKRFPKHRQQTRAVNSQTQGIRWACPLRPRCQPSLEPIQPSSPFIVQFHQITLAACLVLIAMCLGLLETLQAAWWYSALSDVYRVRYLPEIPEHKW